MIIFTIFFFKKMRSKMTSFVNCRNYQMIFSQSGLPSFQSYTRPFSSKEAKPRKLKLNKILKTRNTHPCENFSEEVFCSVLFCTLISILYNTVQYTTVQYSTTQYSIVHSSPDQYSTVRTSD